MLFYVLLAITLVIGNAERSLMLVLAALLALTLSGACKPLVLEFGLGIIVARIYSSLSSDFRLQLGPLCTIGGIALLVTTIFVKIPNDHQILPLLFYGVPSALLVMGLVCLPNLESKFLIHLGDASYSIYLVQALSLSASFKLISAADAFASIPNDLWIVLSVFATIVLGLFSYWVVESPARSILARRNLGPPVELKPVS
jgi:exopolysaccharide production protein ExoZ